MLDLSLDDKPYFQIVKMKMTSNGRQPQDINSGISQKALFGLYSNFKLKVR